MVRRGWEVSTMLKLSGWSNVLLIVQMALKWSSLFYGTERNTQKTRNSLCKSSLQCLISMSCISLDRAQQPLHAGTKGASSCIWQLDAPLLVPLLLRSLCLERTGCANTRAEACIRLTLVVTLTLTRKFQQYEYQHVGVVE